MTPDQLINLISEGKNYSDSVAQFQSDAVKSSGAPAANISGNDTDYKVYLSKDTGNIGKMNDANYQGLVPTIEASSKQQLITGKYGDAGGGHSLISINLNPMTGKLDVSAPKAITSNPGFKSWLDATDTGLRGKSMQDAIKAVYSTDANGNMTYNSNFIDGFNQAVNTAFQNNQIKEAMNQQFKTKSFDSGAAQDYYIISKLSDSAKSGGLSQIKNEVINVYDPKTKKSVAKKIGDVSIGDVINGMTGYKNNYQSNPWTGSIGLSDQELNTKLTAASSDLQNKLLNGLNKYISTNQKNLNESTKDNDIAPELADALAISYGFSDLLGSAGFSNQSAGTQIVGAIDAAGGATFSFFSSMLPETVNLLYSAGKAVGQGVANGGNYLSYFGDNLVDQKNPFNIATNAIDETMNKPINQLAESKAYIGGLTNVEKAGSVVGNVLSLGAMFALGAGLAAAPRAVAIIGDLIMNGGVGMASKAVSTGSRLLRDALADATKGTKIETATARSMVDGAVNDSLKGIDSIGDTALKAEGVSDDALNAIKGRSIDSIADDTIKEPLSFKDATKTAKGLDADNMNSLNRAWKNNIEPAIGSFVNTIARVSMPTIRKFAQKIYDAGKTSLAEDFKSGAISRDAYRKSIGSLTRGTRALNAVGGLINSAFRNLPINVAFSYAGTLRSLNAQIDSGALTSDQAKDELASSFLENVLLATAMSSLPGLKDTLGSTLDLLTGGVASKVNSAISRKMLAVPSTVSNLKVRMDEWGLKHSLTRDIAQKSLENRANSSRPLRSVVDWGTSKKLLDQYEYTRGQNLASGAELGYIARDISTKIGAEEVFAAQSELNRALNIGASTFSGKKFTNIKQAVGRVLNNRDEIRRETNALKKNNGSKKQEEIEQNIAKLNKAIDNDMDLLRQQAGNDMFIKPLNNVHKQLQNSYKLGEDYAHSKNIVSDDMYDMLRENQDYEGYIRMQYMDGKNDGEIADDLTKYFKKSMANVDQNKIIQKIKTEIHDSNAATDPLLTFQDYQYQLSKLVLQNETNRFIQVLADRANAAGYTNFAEKVYDGNVQYDLKQRTKAFDQFNEEILAGVKETTDMYVSAQKDFDPSKIVDEVYDSLLNSEYLKTIAEQRGIPQSRIAKSALKGMRQDIVKTIHDRYVLEGGQEYANRKMLSAQRNISDRISGKREADDIIKQRKAVQDKQVKRINEMNDGELTDAYTRSNNPAERVMINDEMRKRTPEATPDKKSPEIAKRVGKNTDRFHRQIPEVQEQVINDINADPITRKDFLQYEYDIQGAQDLRVGGIEYKTMRGIFSTDIPTARQKQTFMKTHSNDIANPNYQRMSGETREDYGIADLPAKYFSKNGLGRETGRLDRADVDTHSGEYFPEPQELVTTIRKNIDLENRATEAQKKMSELLNDPDYIKQARQEYMYGIEHNIDVIAPDDVDTVAKNFKISKAQAAIEVEGLSRSALNYATRETKPISPTIMKSLTNYLGWNNKADADFSVLDDALNALSAGSTRDINSPLADVAFTRNTEAFVRPLYESGDYATLHTFTSNMRDETARLAEELGYKFNSREIKQDLRTNSNDETALNEAIVYGEKLKRMKLGAYIKTQPDTFRDRGDYLGLSHGFVVEEASPFENFTPFDDASGLIGQKDISGNLTGIDPNTRIAFGTGTITEAADTKRIGRLSDRLKKDLKNIPELDSDVEALTSRFGGTIDNTIFAGHDAPIEALKAYRLDGIKTNDGTDNLMIFTNSKTSLDGDGWIVNSKKYSEYTPEELEEINNITRVNEITRDIYRSDNDQAFKEAMSNDSVLKKIKKEHEGTFDVLNNGQKTTYRIKSPNLRVMYMAHGPSNQMNSVVRMMGKFSNAMRAGTTGVMAPGYAAVNYTRDLWDAGITRGNAFASKLQRDAFKSATALDPNLKMTDEELNKIFDDLGAPWETFNQAAYDASLADSSKEQNRMLASAIENASPKRTRRLVHKATSMKSWYDLASKPGNIVENQRRKQVMENSFMESYREQMPDIITGDITKDDAIQNAKYKAVFDARNATTDFSIKSGNFNGIYASVPYLRSAVNGLQSFGRMFAMDPLGVFSRIIALSVAPVISIAAMNTSDPIKAGIYQQIPEYERNTNLIMMNDDGTYYEIPMPQIVSAFTTPFRALVEHINGVSNSGIGYASLQGLATISPIDFSGFFQRSPSQDTNVNLGLMRMLNSVTPNFVSPFIESFANTSLYTGNPLTPTEEDLINQDIPYHIDENGNIKIDASYFTWTSSNSKTLGWLSETTGIKQGDIQNFLSRYLGTFGKEAINIMDRIQGAPSDQIGGVSMAEYTANRFFGTSPTGASSDFNNGLSKLYDLRDTIVNNTKYNASDDAKNKDINEFMAYFTKFINNYNAYYQAAGGLTDEMRSKLLSVLDFSKSYVSPGNPYANDISQADMYEWDQAQQRALSSGLMSAGGLDMNSQGVVNADTGEVKYSSPALSLWQNEVYGTPKVAQDDFEDAAVDKTIFNGQSLDDLYKLTNDEVSKVYDRADAAGRAPTDKEYDEIDSYSAAFMDALDQIMKPIVEQNGTSIFSNKEFMAAIDKYARFGIDRDTWTKGTNGRWLSTTKYPNVEAKLKTILTDRYSGLQPKLKNSITVDNSQAVDALMQQIKGDLQ